MIADGMIIALYNLLRLRITSSYWSLINLVTRHFLLDFYCVVRFYGSNSWLCLTIEFLPKKRLLLESTGIKTGDHRSQEVYCHIKSEALKKGGSRPGRLNVIIY